MTADALLAELVAIPSVSRDEGRVASALARVLAGNGLAVNRVGNSLWFEIGAGRPRLLLASHIDTVPPCEGWTVDPHAGRWADGTLIGLGANDAKGCVAAMTDAALALSARASSLDGTLVVAFTAEEEVGGGGITAVRPHLGPLDAAVIGEPTGLEVCVAQRGMLILRCVSHGKAAHAAHAELGVNAIHAAALDIVRLGATSAASHPLLGDSAPQVTQVTGGRARNQVPDACEFFVDLRTLPGEDPEAIASRLRSELTCEVHVHSSRYVACATDPAHPLVASALEAAGRTTGIGSRTTSDWAFLADLPAVKIGPGETGRSHRPDEYITSTELAAGVAFYRRFVPACLGRLAAGAGTRGTASPEVQG